MKLNDKQKADALENMMIGIDTGVRSDYTGVAIFIGIEGHMYQVHGRMYKRGQEIPPITGKEMVRILEEDEYGVLKDIYSGAFKNEEK